MEAILKFQLPEEQHEHEQAVNAYKWVSVVWDIDQFLRSMLKYEGADGIMLADLKTPEEALEKVRERLWDNLNERGLNLD